MLQSSQFDTYTLSDITINIQCIEYNTFYFKHVTHEIRRSIIWHSIVFIIKTDWRGLTSELFDNNYIYMYVKIHDFK